MFSLIFREFCTCFNHFDLPSPTLSRFTLFPFLPNFVVFFLPLPHQGQFVLLKYSWMCGLPLQHSRHIKGCIHRENWHFLSKQLRITHSYSKRVGTLWNFMPNYPICARIWAALSLIMSCTSYHSHCEFIFADTLLYTKDTLFPCSPPLPLTLVPYPLLQWPLSFWRRWCRIYAPIMP